MTDDETRRVSLFPPGAPTLTVSRQDWSLHRKGMIDKIRHDEKVKEAIKGNLPEIVADESLIGSDGDRIIKVPVRGLVLPHFRYGDTDRDRVGQGQGDSKIGDVIGQGPPGPGQGTGAGNQPGVDYYEAEITVDEVIKLVFDDFQLPYLQPKGRQLVADDVRFTDLRPKGIMSNLDKRKTLLANMRRNATLEGLARVKGISVSDLRFRTWEETTREEHGAVVIAMRDVSGSMGEFEKYISRTFYLWMVHFLRSTYATVEIVFLTHHTEAKEVDEETFFKLGEGGGTKVSSAYDLALKVIAERYPAAEWNIYPFHFSDGDNWGDADNQTCRQLLAQLLALSNVVGYGEIRANGRSASSLWTAYQQIKDPRFTPVVIAKKEDVLPALRTFFAPRDAAAPPAVPSGSAA